LNEQNLEGKKQGVSLVASCKKIPTTFPKTRCLHPCYRGCVAIGPARGRRSRGWAVTSGEITLLRTRKHIPPMEKEQISCQKTLMGICC